ncbi:TonB-linked SusC/RagA family outer membrane protein [Chitinophaga terrae (ex Kim and Jung 2007)]|uniref:SusC/RagA family TonB-linked outer membrane protein n=1 Tax=Chitinophaga terrae (ex Kim and Jung 2007) TaxID=408074 RepID=UPI0027827E45|nr:TonB-dependent receptor [Chitinophaga terrae (ex Kim and Jung 2007)]MDQ0110181.1 TonB-linked SusC/RagA family outer membrane protein [Chitinophaga terrae (ex Kim and Jung 2007)]
MKKQFSRALAALFGLLLLFAHSGVFAQAPVTGTVTDKASGNPLPGVSVAIKGTNKGTATDPSGKFNLTVKAGQTLVFSFVGYDPQEVVVGTGPVNVQLSEKVGSLEEVVVTGYASQKKKDLTGAVSVVKVENLTKQPTSQIASQLQGQVSGVTVLGGGQPGQEPQVKIRGINTFGNNTPLYIVDGVPISNLADVNPNDVQTMQVLKDAGAASIYGARAANGVIVITTKRGTGKVKVNYDGYYGRQVPQSGNVWNLLNPQEQANLKWMAIANSPGNPFEDAQYGNGSTPVLPDYIAPEGLKEGDPRVNPDLYFVNPNYKNAGDLDKFYRITKANKQGTDWFHEIFKPAPITSHNVSVAGGGDIGSYFFSFYYFNQQGTLLNTYNKRYAVRANSSFNVTDHIRVGQNMEYSIINNPQIGTLVEGSGIGMAFRELTIIPVYDIKGNYAGSSGKDLGNARNPVAIQDRFGRTKTLASRLLGNVYAEADILKNFTLRTSFGGEIYSFNNRNFTLPEYENAENNKVNSYTETTGNGYDWTWTNTLTYHKNFSQQHDLKVMIGTEAYDNQFRTLTGTTTDYFSFDPNFANLSTGAGTPTNGSDFGSDGLFSLFARVDYAFKDRYLVGALIRRDGSSRFGSSNRYGNFPAASVAWRISQEEFMKNISWISDLKIRAGYGIMGNQINVTPSNQFIAYGFDRTSSFYSINGAPTTSKGFIRRQIGNPNAKWESNVNSNIGIDATLFKGVLEFTLDYYNKEVRDLLYNPELAGVFGAATVPFTNVAKMKNHGWDLSITFTKDLAKDLKLTANGALTTYKNEILAISESAPYFDLESRRFGSPIIRNAIGQSISEFFGYKIIGFWDSKEEVDAANAAAKAKYPDLKEYQLGAAMGRFKYADVNGDGKVDADDRTFLGNPNPKFSYGLNLNLAYKQFDLSAFFYGVQGNKIWNQVRWWTDFYPSFVSAKSKTALYDSWRPDHKNATAPIQEVSSSPSTSGAPNSYFVENGSYLRLKNIQVGYTLPSYLLKRVGVEKFRVYVQAANLFTITKYTGIDPEVAGNTQSFGLDEGAYPNQRQYLIGVNVGF